MPDVIRVSVAALCRTLLAVFPRMVLALVLAAGGAGIGDAQAQSKWTLDPASSTLTYQSIKKNTIVETNSIRNITGEITPDGAAKVVFDLDSVDTGVDLRNVRMRFLFFETFKYPTAEVTAKLDPAAFADLATKRRMTASLPFKLNLHGVEKELTADVVVTMITEGMVSVASKAPIAVNVADFGLMPGVEKLQQAANVSSIVPTASVSFDFVFGTDVKPAEPVKPAIAAASEQVAPETVAAVAGPVETDTGKTAFTTEECLNRFEVLSRTGAIYFRAGSSQLDEASRPLLTSVLNVVTKCPSLKIEVAGHTDSDGPAAVNLRLSQQRADAVATFITQAGVPTAQIVAAGYGEDRPIAANDTAKHKALNRRIEFSASPSAH